MELHQLYLFKEVAELGNVTRASEKLHISQPALSKTIKSIEMELNVKLFDRKNRRIYLNKNGEILLKHTKKIFSEIYNIYIEIGEFNNNLNNHVTLSMLVATKLLPEILSSFHDKYPFIKVSISQETSCDLKIFSSSSLINEKNCLLIFRENLVLAVPINHRLAKRDSISLYEVKDEDFISLSYEKNLGHLTMEYCKLAGFKPNIIFESDSPSIIRDIVKLGLGVSLFPEISWKDVVSNSIKLLHIENPNCHRYFYLQWDEDKIEKQSLIYMKKHLIDFFKNLTNRK